MRISGISGVSAVRSAAVVPSDPVVLRLNAVRRGLREHGAVIINPDSKIDQEVVSRLQKVHGEENVVVERSKNARLTVTNFKR